jgi:hypothetical protein
VPAAPDSGAGATSSSRASAGSTLNDYTLL